MQTAIVILVVLAVALGSLLGAYLVYRRGLRYAKGIERGIKMVPILINLPPPSEDAELGGRDVRDVIQERISQAEVLYNLIASTATKGFKSKFFGQRHISLEIVAIHGVIRFYAAVPVAMVPVIKQAILTAYPGAQLEEVEDHNIFSETGKISGTYGGEISLKKDYSYPIATFNQLKRDAVQGIINALTSLEQGDGASIQILLRPAHEGWVKKSESLVKKKREDKGKSGISPKTLLQAPFKVPESGGGGDSPKPPKQLSNLEQSALDAIEEKTKTAGYEVLIRVISSSGTAAKAQAITGNIVSAFSLFDAPGLNGFKLEPAKNMENFVTDFIFRFFPPEKRKMILNSVELSTLFHFPDDQFTKTSQVQRQYSKQVEGPSRVAKDGLIVGHNSYHGVKKDIRLSDDDRRRHVYIVGQTGTGKSTLLENLMAQDMNSGKGFAFIDPHGDAAEKMLGMVPKERSEDVIYFDPGNMDYPLGLNIFEYHTEDQKDFLIQEAINMLYSLYDPTRMGIIGPRYEHLFRNAALTVMADPKGGTFVDIPKLFRDPQFVKQKLEHVTDQSVLEFWQKEMPQSQRSNEFGDVVSWFVSKFGAFLSNQMMRNIIGQTESAFDLREVMDSKKILIANLSKGRLGELNSKLLGMIFIMKFQAAAMSRASLPEDQRQDFSLYVDEFQNFSTESFAFILSEARKYRMNLIVANQFISQLSEEVRDAVFGNVGTVVSFRTGPNDADFLVKQFAPAFNDRDLVNLPNFNAAVRLMSGGLPSQPFNITTLPPLQQTSPALAAALKKLSAAKHGASREEVEAEIFDRLSTKPAPSPFESLATSRKNDHAPQPSGGPPGTSSFLDEWLAKRRQAMATKDPGNPLKSTPDPSADPKTVQPGLTGSQPSVRRGTPPPSGKMVGPVSSAPTAMPSKPVAEPKRQQEELSRPVQSHATSESVNPSSASQPSLADSRPSVTDSGHTDDTGAKASPTPNPTSEPASSPVDAANNENVAAFKPPVSPKETLIKPQGGHDGGSDANTGDSLSEDKNDHLIRPSQPSVGTSQDKQNKSSTETGAQSTPVKDNPSASTSAPTDPGSLPDLKPGEIFIDDEGNIHHG